MSKIIPIDGDKIRLPGASDRITIVGRTGSGKTMAALWHLSHANFHRQPWIVIDPKIEETINSIDGAIQYDMESSQLPKRPGIYIVHPRPTEDGLKQLNEFLLSIWEHENIGVYCDEGYLYADGDGFVSCLTQGRSKHIPMIICSQRPVMISRFCFSEANFFQVFSLNDKRDRAVVKGFVPLEKNFEQKEFFSWYYDVSKNRLFQMAPVPPANELVGRIEDRLEVVKPSVRRM